MFRSLHLVCAYKLLAQTDYSLQAVWYEGRENVPLKGTTRQNEKFLTSRINMDMGLDERRGGMIILSLDAPFFHIYL